MSQKRRSRADEPFLLVRALASDHRAGDAIERHAHDWHQLIYASAGVLTVWTESGSWIAPPHWAIWVPAATRHGIRFAAGSAFRTLYLRPEWSLDLPARCSAVTVSPLLRELILKTVRTGMLDTRDPHEAALATLILDEFRQAQVPPFELAQPISAAARRAAELIERSAEPLDGAALARAAGIGLRTLERRFRAETGLSPAAWRRRHGLLTALERLAAGDSVKAVATASGYAAPSAFVAAFRAAFGITPGRYFEHQR
ncbi:MAG: helix-turn-helix protein AraC type [Alphaproteobacteria bacterium]|nr:helix-turn-helix protein AraC type [Alphaproteobacteria bacterium]